MRLGLVSWCEQVVQEVVGFVSDPAAGNPTRLGSAVTRGPADAPDMGPADAQDVAQVPADLSGRAGVRQTRWRRDACDSGGPGDSGRAGNAGRAGARLRRRGGPARGRSCRTLPRRGAGAGGVAEGEVGRAVGTDGRVIRRRPDVLVDPGLVG